ncbi:zf-H2C2-domain-containing protein, partial [Ascoidea rubescens DSM 1968]
MNQNILAEYNQLNVSPITVLLKDDQTSATIYPIESFEDLPPGLLAFLCDEFNAEIERGETYPFFDTLEIELFKTYWFGSFAAVMLLGSDPYIQQSKQWEKECLGTFYIKPNYPGRCSHICSGGFLVNAGIRNRGIGKILTQTYLNWAPHLGYSYSIFNLVFDINYSAKHIFDSFNFKKIGKIKSAGILKGHDNAIDAIIYGRELAPILNHNDSTINSGSYRFDKIKFYLETGKYPPMADRQEKSRLRSSAAHYKLLNGKLMLKNKEVISDPSRQIKICTEVHMINHGGINKTTAAIAERYHWTRIKDTVAQVIKNCRQCRD